MSHTLFSCGVVGGVGGVAGVDSGIDVGSPGEIDSVECAPVAQVVCG